MYVLFLILSAIIVHDCPLGVQSLIPIDEDPINPGVADWEGPTATLQDESTLTPASRSLIPPVMVTKHMNTQVVYTWSVTTDREYTATCTFYIYLQDAGKYHN